jgi:RNA polymerase sigma-70 factor (ECF subfamily)
MTAGDDELADELAARVAAGDGAAFAPLVERYHHQIYGLVWRRLRNEAAAADVCQEAFVRVWKGLRNGKYVARDGANLRSWIFQIARNTLVDLLPKRKEVPLEHAPEPSAVPDPSDPAAVVREGMRQLPPEQRDVLELELDGFTQEEMAALRGVPRRRIVYLKGLAVAALRSYCEAHLGAVA